MSQLHITGSKEQMQVLAATVRAGRGTSNVFAAVAMPDTDLYRELTKQDEILTYFLESLKSQGVE